MTNLIGMFYMQIRYVTIFGIAGTILYEMVFQVIVC